LHFFAREPLALTKRLDSSPEAAVISAASPQWVDRESAARRSAAAVLLLAVAALPALAQPRVNRDPPQRGGAPKQDTPYIIVGTFRGDSRQLGVEVADEVRKRIASEHSAQELFVVTKHNIDATLTASGYSADSALNPNDLMELAKQLHGEYVLDASVSKSDNGIRVDPRLMLKTSTTTMTQPLPTVHAKDAGEAAKIVDRQVSEAIKGIAPYKLCVTDLRAGNWAGAAKNAAAGITAYPNSTLSRLCLLSAVTGSKGSPDSVVAVASGVIAIDSVNTLALGSLFDAHVAKNDAKKALDVGTRLLAIDPNNRELAKRLVQMYVTDNQSDRALALIETLLKDNPGDVELVSTKWKVLLAASRFKEAIDVGEELAKLDPSQVTIDYFNRMLGAAQKGDSTAIVRLAEAAAQKFPKEISFVNLVTSSSMKAGNFPKALEWARKASAIDPKDPIPWQFIIAVQSQMHQPPDSLVATGQAAVKAGVSPDTLSASLMTIASTPLAAAQKSGLRADWMEALKASQTVDAITPSARAKFYIGVSAFSIAADATQSVQKLYNGGKPAKGDAAKACDEIKVAEDNFGIAGIFIPQGGRFEPKTAGELMGNMGQYTQFVSQVKTALKCK
jgi:tetratricopeptide (TPR) repeat protein